MTEITLSAVTIDSVVENFVAEMTGGRQFSLDSYRGKTVVIYFYPKDNTPGCTTESIAFRDLAIQFEENNAVIFGLSRDSIKSHEGFKAKLDLPFELISDKEEFVCQQFSVIKMKNMYGKKVRGIERSTFIIDKDGKLVHEWRGVKVAGHVDEVLETVKALNN